MLLLFNSIGHLETDHDERQLHRLGANQGHHIYLTFVPRKSAQRHVKKRLPRIIRAVYYNNSRAVSKWGGGGGG